MALGTLVCAKHLEQAGVDRLHAEAHAEAISRFLVPDLATRADLTAGLNNLEHRLEARIHQAELRILGVVAAMPGLLFALMKFTPS